MTPMTSAAASPMVPARAGMTMAPLLAVPARREPLCRHRPRLAPLYESGGCGTVSGTVTWL
jgi:hypothetical protein